MDTVIFTPLGKALEATPSAAIEIAVAKIGGRVKIVNKIKLPTRLHFFVFRPFRGLDSSI